MMGFAGGDFVDRLWFLGWITWMVDVRFFAAGVV